MAILETLFVLGLAAFIFAYLFGNSANENIGFKILFLFLSLISLFSAQMVAYESRNDVAILMKYNTTNDYTGQEILNTTSIGASSVLFSYMEVFVYIPEIVGVILIILFLDWLLKSFTNRGRDKGVEI